MQRQYANEIFVTPSVCLFVHISFDYNFIVLSLKAITSESETMLLFKYVLLPYSTRLIPPR